MTEATHFARQRPGQPNKGRQTCRTCGQPIARVGRHVASDGVRGQWKHVKPTAPTITGRLLAAGWARDDTSPPGQAVECGVLGDVSGWCARPGRWTKRGMRKGDLPMCAHHAWGWQQERGD